MTTLNGAGAEIGARPAATLRTRWRAVAVASPSSRLLRTPPSPTTSVQLRVPGAGSTHGTQQMVELFLTADHDRRPPQACPTPHRPSIADYDQRFHGCAALPAAASFQAEMRVMAPVKGVLLSRHAPGSSAHSISAIRRATRPTAWGLTWR